jgi:hypothetical protein
MFIMIEMCQEKCRIYQLAEQSGRTSTTDHERAAASYYRCGESIREAIETLKSLSSSIYLVCLTSLETSDSMGIHLRRTGLEIVDTIVIQCAEEEWYGFLVRSQSEETLVEEAICKGADVLMDIDQGRIEVKNMEHHSTAGPAEIATDSGIYRDGKRGTNQKQLERKQQGLNPRYNPNGRWPTNVIFVHHPDCDTSLS